MKPSLSSGLLVLVLALLVLAFLRWRATYKAPARHLRVRSRKSADLYAEMSTGAKLLNDVLALKSRDAQWPDILQTLNPDDEPRIRTVLLELRWPHVLVPHAALSLIETVCLAADRSGDAASRLDLLERAKLSMEKITRSGD